MGCSIFPFSSMPSFSVWLTIRGIIQVREGTICSSSCLFCLEYYCFRPVFETNSGLNRKCSLFRVLEYPLFCLCYSILDVTRLLCTCLEFCWVFMHDEFSRISCSWDIWNATCNWTAKKSENYTYLLCSNACFFVPSDYMHELQVQR